MTADQLFTVAMVVALSSGVFGILATVIGQMFTWQMSAEQRRRELEDRREVVKAAKAASDAAALAATQAKKAAAVAANALQVVHVAVQEVGVQAVAAYQEANNANLKIQAVQDVLTANMGLPDKPITAEAVRKKGACE